MFGKFEQEQSEEQSQLNEATLEEQSKGLGMNHFLQSAPAVNKQEGEEPSGELQAPEREQGGGDGDANEGNHPNSGSDGADADPDEDPWHWLRQELRLTDYQIVEQNEEESLAQGKILSQLSQTQAWVEGQALLRRENDKLVEVQLPQATYYQEFDGVRLVAQGLRYDTSAEVLYFLTGVLQIPKLSSGLKVEISKGYYQAEKGLQFSQMEGDVTEQQAGELEMPLGTKRISLEQLSDGRMSISPQGVQPALEGGDLGLPKNNPSTPEIITPSIDKTVRPDFFGHHERNYKKNDEQCDIGIDSDGCIIFIPVGYLKMRIQGPAEITNEIINGERLGETGNRVIPNTTLEGGKAYGYYGIDGYIFDNEGNFVLVTLVLDGTVFEIDHITQTWTTSKNGKKDVRTKYTSGKVHNINYDATTNCTGLAFLKGEFVLDSHLVTDDFLANEGYLKTDDLIDQILANNDPAKGTVGLYLEQVGDKKLVKHAEIFTGGLNGIYPEVESKGGVTLKEKAMFSNTWAAWNGKKEEEFKNRNYIGAIPKFNRADKMIESFSYEQGTHTESGLKYGQLNNRKVRIVSETDAHKIQKKIKEKK